MSTVTDPDDVRHELAALAGRVEAVERRLGVARAEATALPFDLAAIMSDVQQITQELFPGPCKFTSEFDPEYPEDRYVVVRVAATGDPSEIVDRSLAWDERVRRLRPDLWDALRLMVIPQ